MIKIIIFNCDQVQSFIINAKLQAVIFLEYKKMSTFIKILNNWIQFFSKLVFRYLHKILSLAFERL